ncbi:hypothetical protein ABKN59_006984 [Abortiporus biennis]
MAFITKLARSSTIPPLRHLHTLKLDASHLPLLELGLALSKLPALVELTENDSRVRVLNSSQALQDFENSLSKEALPNLRKIRVHYQIAPSLCRNRKLQSSPRWVIKQSFILGSVYKGAGDDRISKQDFNVPWMRQRKCFMAWLYLRHYVTLKFGVPHYPTNINT